jgi:hypothetical protein
MTLVSRLSRLVRMGTALAGTTAQPLPELGMRVPGLVVRLLPGVVGALLTLLCFRHPFFLIVGVGLALVAVVLPRRMAGWALILLLASSRLPADATWDTRFLVLLAGLHALHLLAAVSFEVPLRSWVQVAVLRPVALRFLVIQVPTQALAAVVLSLRGAASWSAPLLGLVGGLALLGIAALLVVPLLEEGAPRASDGPV